MLTTITAKVSDVVRLKALYGDARGGKAAQAIQAAISATVVSGRAFTAQRLSEEVNLTPAQIKDSISIVKSTYSSPVGKLIISDEKKTWLAQFLTSGQRRTAASKIKRGKFKGAGGLNVGGVTVSVRRNPTPNYPTIETLPHAFLDTTPHSTNLGIFERTGVKRVMKSGASAGKIREVIHRLRGPSAYSVFTHARGEGGAATLVAETAEKLTETLGKNLKGQMKRFGST